MTSTDQVTVAFTANLTRYEEALQRAAARLQLTAAGMDQLGRSARSLARGTGLDEVSAIDRFLRAVQEAHALDAAHRRRQRRYATHVWSTPARSRVWATYRAKTRRRNRRGRR